MLIMEFYLALLKSAAWARSELGQAHMCVRGIQKREGGLRAHWIPSQVHRVWVGEDKESPSDWYSILRQKGNKLPPLSANLQLSSSPGPGIDLQFRE